MDCRFCLSSSRNWESAGFRAERHQRLGFLALLLQLLFDGGVGQGGFFLVLRFRLGLRFAKSLRMNYPIGSTVLQRIDEEASSIDRSLATASELSSLRAVVRLGKPLDLGAAAREGFRAPSWPRMVRAPQTWIEGVV